MVVIRVDFLRGCYVAEEPTAKGSPEWPPAPARLFAALVSSAYAIDVDPAPLTALESAPELRFGEATAAPGSVNYVPAAFIKAGNRPNRETLRPQMARIAERAAKIATMSKSLTLVANNHYQGKEFVNALQARAAFSGGKVKAPPTLIERYPQLREIAE